MFIYTENMFQFFGNRKSPLNNPKNKINVNTEGFFVIKFYKRNTLFTELST